MKSYFIFLLLFSCYAHGNIEKFNSAHSIALDGLIEQGSLLTKTTNTEIITSEIKNQLQFIVGQLNGLNGGSPDLSKSKIFIESVQPFEGQSTFKVIYRAHLLISWPIEIHIPEKYKLILPSGGGYNYLNKFFTKFGNDENTGKRCLGNSAHDVTSGIFWYYYRPNKYTCELGNRYFESDLSTTTNLYLKRSELNSKNKYPEYDKIWEDGKLIITAIFGMADDQTVSIYDEGVTSYEKLVRILFSTYGMPSSSNIELTDSLFAHFRYGLKHPELHFEFETDQGIIDVSLFLITGIRQVYGNSDFIEKYNERTKVSDFISYSGHSGLGANIRMLAKMGTFLPDQYQIFLINGCDTFAYVDNALAKAHQLVNPDFGPNKYLDIITNAMPSYFYSNARSNISVITALFEQKKSYQEILANFEYVQRAAVTGEEDNNWPLPFN